MTGQHENLPATSLLVNVVKDLVIEFKANPNVTAVILTGSYAKKSQKPYSDVDITVFYKDFSQIGSETDIRYYNDTLITISSANIPMWEKEMTDAKLLMFRYRSIMDAVILFDRNHELGTFRSNISPTPWVYAEADRRDRMDKLAIGYIEEIHKLLNMMLEFDESTAVYALTGLSMGMAELVALHYKLLFGTENEYFDLIQSTVGWNSRWTQLFREVFNIQLVADFETIDMKIVPGLNLYRETMSFVTLSDHATDMVSKALKLINLRLLKPK